MVPAVVACHRVALERAPLLRTHKGVDGACGGGDYVLWTVAVEEEARGRAQERCALEAAGRGRLENCLMPRCLGRIHDRIRQPAHARRHGQGAVAHRVDLREAAGLEPAAVQENVCTGMQYMRAALVKTYIDTDPIGPCPRQALKRGFDMRFTLPND